MSLTKEEIEELRSRKKIHDPHSLEDGIDPDSDKPIEFPWRTGDGRSDVTTEMCNAVRCAADDGKSYAEIAEMFSFLSGKKHAQRHATGDCSHSGGVEPTGTGNDPGPPNGKISKRTCSKLRRGVEKDKFETYAEAGEWLGIAKSAAWRHINGECEHG